jgi:hypothetical protein
LIDNTGSKEEALSDRRLTKTTGQARPPRLLTTSHFGECEVKCLSGLKLALVHTKSLGDSRDESPHRRVVLGQVRLNELPSGSCRYSWTSPQSLRSWSQKAVPRQPGCIDVTIRVFENESEPWIDRIIDHLTAHEINRPTRRFAIRCKPILTCAKPCNRLNAIESVVH